MIKKQKYCEGCYNDIYNTGGECWYLKEAKVVDKKKIHINDRPPWDSQEIVRVNDCYRKPKFGFVNPKTRY